MCTRQPYPSDVSDDEMAFVAPYLTLVAELALQRKHDLREVYNALRLLVRTGVGVTAFNPMLRVGPPSTYPKHAAAGPDTRHCR